MMTLDSVEAVVKFHNGFRSKPYNSETKKKLASRSVGKICIGYGRDLGKGLTEEEAEYLLRHDIDKIFDELQNALPKWTRIDKVRQAVLIDMCDAIGIKRVLSKEEFITLLVNGLWRDAANEIAGIKSRRADRWRHMITTGEWPSIGA